MMKNLMPRPSRSFACRMSIDFNDGAIQAMEPENKIIDAMPVTAIGIMTTAVDRAVRDGGHRRVRAKIATSDIVLPITGNADDRAVFWYAAATDDMTLTIIWTQKQATSICNAFVISGLWMWETLSRSAQSITGTSNSSIAHNGKNMITIIR